MNSQKYSSKPFGEALAELLQKRQTSPYSPLGLRGFAAEIGVNHSTLRSAVMGRTNPKQDLLELCAKALNVEPSYFKEWRANKIAEMLESDPDKAGQYYEAAVEIYKKESE